MLCFTRFKRWTYYIVGKIPVDIHIVITYNYHIGANMTQPNDDYDEDFDEDMGYDRSDPKHPTYSERMADMADYLRERARDEAMEAAFKEES